MSTEKITGRVLSNDGERAEVLLSNGERLHIDRIDPLAESHTVEEFLEDLPIGEIKPEFLIEKILLQ